MVISVNITTAAGAVGLTVFSGYFCKHYYSCGCCWPVCSVVISVNITTAADAVDLCVQ